MATRLVCDRCGAAIGTDPGLTFDIADDLVRGLRGHYDLCGACSDGLGGFLHGLSRVQPISADEVRAYAAEVGDRLTAGRP